MRSKCEHTVHVGRCITWITLWITLSICIVSQKQKATFWWRHHMEGPTCENFHTNGILWLFVVVISTFYMALCKIPLRLDHFYLLKKIISSYFAIWLWRPHFRRHEEKWMFLKVWTIRIEFVKKKTKKKHLRWKNAAKTLLRSTHKQRIQFTSFKEGLSYWHLHNPTTCIPLTYNSLMLIFCPFKWGSQIYFVLVMRELLRNDVSIRRHHAGHALQSCRGTKLLHQNVLCCAKR